MNIRLACAPTPCAKTVVTVIFFERLRLLHIYSRVPVGDNNNSSNASVSGAVRYCEEKGFGKIRKCRQKHYYRSQIETPKLDNR